MLGSLTTLSELKLSMSVCVADCWHDYFKRRL
jgi:hypothetical protein